MYPLWVSFFHPTVAGHCRLYRILFLLLILTLLITPLTCISNKKPPVECDSQIFMYCKP